MIDYAFEKEKLEILYKAATVNEDVLSYILAILCSQPDLEKTAVCIEHLLTKLSIETLLANTTTILGFIPGLG